MFSAALEIQDNKDFFYGEYLLKELLIKEKINVFTSANPTPVYQKALT